jgi:hypothetical protein
MPYGFEHVIDGWIAGSEREVAQPLHLDISRSVLEDPAHQPTVVAVGVVQVVDGPDFRTDSDQYESLV